MRIQRFAATTGSVVKTLNNVKVLGNELKALDNTNGIIFDVKNYSNDRIMFLIVNTDTVNAQDVTIKGGDGYAARDDLIVSIPKSDFALCSVETASYASNGKVTIKGGPSVKACAGYIG